MVSLGVRGDRGGVGVAPGLGRQAGEFHWLHVLAVDSHGDIYTGEVDTGQRVQRFLRYGADGCSGMGSADVGRYDANR